MTRYDAIVIGGGLVGSAIVYGLAREGLRIALVDEGDVAYRASRGNFGLVWVQSNATALRTTSAGLGARPINGRRSLPSCRRARRSRSGTSDRPGGVHLCLGEAELEERRARMERMRIQSGNFGFEYRMLDRRG